MVYDSYYTLHFPCGCDKTQFYHILSKTAVKRIANNHLAECKAAKEDKESIYASIEYYPFL